MAKTLTIAGEVVGMLVMLMLCGCDFRLYIAHYAKMAGWSTRLCIQNPYVQTVGADVQAFDDAGNLQAETSVLLPAKGSYKALVQDVFSPTPIPDTGSLRITVHEPGNVPKVNAIVLFEYPAGPSLGGLQSMGNPQCVLRFPWFENSAANATGVCLLNVNPYPIQAVMKAQTPAGVTYTSNTFTLKPMQRIVGYPSMFFPSPVAEDTTLHAYGSGPIAGYIILHDSTLQKVEAINGVPLVPRQPECKSTPINTGIDLNARPVKMIFSPDGNYLYLRTESPPSLVSVDRYANTVFFSASWHGSGDIVLSPDGLFTYCSDVTDDCIYKAMTQLPDNMPLWRVFATMTDPWYLCVSRDGRFVGAASGTEFQIFDAVTGNVVFSDSAKQHLVGCQFSFDSKFFLAVDYEAKKLYHYDLESATVGEVSLGAAAPRSVYQSSLDGLIYIGTEGDEVIRLIYPGFSPTSSLTVAGSHEWLTESPDGRKVYIPSYNTGRLWVYDPLQSGFDNPGGYDLGGGVIRCAVAPEGDGLYYVVNALPFTIKYCE